MLAGKVKVGGIVVDKPGSGHPSDAVIEVERGDAYVSRGGEKLAHAVDVQAAHPRAGGGGHRRLHRWLHRRAPQGRRGHGVRRRRRPRPAGVEAAAGRARQGHGQDERALSHRRRFRPSPRVRHGGRVVHLAVRILPALYDVLLPGGHAICLVKPQFEAGREKVGKRGVVRSPEVHREVLEACMGYAAASGFTVLGVTPSPIRGPEGNVEFLMYLAKPAQDAAPHAGRPEQPDFAALAREAVELAHAQRTDE